MVPLRDNVPTRIAPVAVVAFMLANAAVFLVEQRVGARGPDAVTAFFDAWGLVPRELLRGMADPGATQHLVWVTPVTSMFLHAGWLHLGSNMLFLWIFGSNVEDLLGHGRFVVFYLACGLAAGCVQVASQPASYVPVVGASGAVGGVLGAYALAYPRARVHALLPIGFFWTSVKVPAVALLGVWFVIQVLSGLASLGDEAAGVAFWAHVGGFLAGTALQRPMRIREPLRGERGRG